MGLSHGKCTPGVHSRTTLLDFILITFTTLLPVMKESRKAALIFYDPFRLIILYVSHVRLAPIPIKALSSTYSDYTILLIP